MPVIKTYPSLEQRKQHKATEIEKERALRSEYMPYTLPDGAQVQVKLKEEPPHKPRLSWLIGAAVKGQANKDDTAKTKDLIAADDTRHPLTMAEWVEVGEAMGEWIQSHIDAAHTHYANIAALTTAQEIINYDVTIGWPE